MNEAIAQALMQQIAALEREVNQLKTRITPYSDFSGRDLNASGEVVIDLSNFVHGGGVTAIGINEVSGSMRITGDGTSSPAIQLFSAGSWRTL